MSADRFADPTDDDLARWTRYYERRLALVDEETVAGLPAVTPEDLGACSLPWLAYFQRRGLPPAMSREELRDSTAAYYEAQLVELRHEDLRRRRAAARGVAREGNRVPDEVLDAIRRAIRLDGAYELETGLALRPPDAASQRRGPCPFCGVKGDLGPFYVHLADPDDEWWYCHACDLHGDLFDLVRQVYRVDFRRAVMILAPRCGIAWPPAPPSPVDLLALAREGRTHG
ncbi:MAG TPA: hypothetical protein VFL91_10270 [Thermomicrobiales bacterium]|nr:hypothetical protein [Thermomicrobiales bacterium]